MPSSFPPFVSRCHHFSPVIYFIAVTLPPPSPDPSPWLSLSPLYSDVSRPSPLSCRRKNSSSVTTRTTTTPLRYYIHLCAQCRVSFSLPRACVPLLSLPLHLAPPRRQPTHPRSQLLHPWALSTLCSRGTRLLSLPLSLSRVRALCFSIYKERESNAVFLIYKERASSERREACQWKVALAARA